MPEFPPPLRRSIDKFCSTYSLQPFNYHTFYFQAEPLNIIFMPREFHPAEEVFDERFKFVGPSIYQCNKITESRITEFPLERMRTQPILYISLGTVITGVPAFYDICMHAFGNQSQQVVMSIGDKVDLNLFGPLPGNIIMHPHVPQLDILQRTEVFITHGGTNSVMEALYYGVLLVVSPNTGEHTVVAKRIEELKLGMAIKDMRSITAYTLRNAVAQLKDNLEVRANVQRMRDVMMKSGGYKSAADAILQFSK